MHPPKNTLNHHHHQHLPPSAYNPATNPHHPTNYKLKLYCHLRQQLEEIMAMGRHQQQHQGGGWHASSSSSSPVANHQHQFHHIHQNSTNNRTAAAANIGATSTTPTSASTIMSHHPTTTTTSLEPQLQQIDKFFQECESNYALHLEKNAELMAPSERPVSGANGIGNASVSSVSTSSSSSSSATGSGISTTTTSSPKQFSCFTLSQRRNLLYQVIRKARSAPRNWGGSSSSVTHILEQYLEKRLNCSQQQIQQALQVNAPFLDPNDNSSNNNSNNTADVFAHSGIRDRTVSPLYVNERQYHRMVRRRLQRANQYRRLWLKKGATTVGTPSSGTPTSQAGTPAGTPTSLGPMPPRPVTPQHLAGIPPVFISKDGTRAPQPILTNPPGGFNNGRMVVLGVIRRAPNGKEFQLVPSPCTTPSSAGSSSNAFGMFGANFGAKNDTPK